MPVTVNLGGEGEVQGALNVNAFITPQMFSAGFADDVEPALVLHRSAHDTGLPDGYADHVIANHFPIQHDQLITDLAGTRVGIDELAVEVVRILRPGGDVRFACSSCDRTNLANAFKQAGLIRVTIDGDQVRGIRP